MNDHADQTTMRRALAEPLAGVRIESAPRPTPAPGEVLVRSTLVGICGSDTHALAGHHPFLTAAYVPGHEAIGIVASSGPGAEGFTPGQRVLLKPNVACGDCLNCRAQRSNACETLAWIGCDPSRTLSGAMADEFVAPARNLFAIPEGVDDDTAVLIECLATPVHAARIAGDLHGARAVVLGAGTIGALCVIAARAAGAASVVVTDREQAKLDRAVRIGADAGVLASDPDATAKVIDALGGRADVVFDCVAIEASLAQAVSLLRRAGTLLIVGVPPRPAPLNLPIIQDWEIRVQGCAAYTEADILTSIEIAAGGGLPASEIISGRFPLSDAAAAFEQASADSSGKVVITVG
ncbi:MAG: alcohol dehydrogenase catalytic domain-containing protein [Propioniciclava sp.]|uniref:zinc-dependent alcohol dehydrogenase n=1 Tax=Propioniciclava sp. TaxID=2038686 RepID=UPI0039E39D43